MKKLRRIINLLSLKLMIESELLNITIFSVKVTYNWSREIFIIDSVLKTNPWTYEIKNLNREKIIGSFYEKELLLIIL